MFRFIKEKSESEIIGLHRELLQDSTNSVKIPQGKQKKLFEMGEGYRDSLGGII